MAIDPICGMTVDESTAISAERDGNTFYFCCEHCRNKFLGTASSQSASGLTPVGLAPPAPKARDVAIYTCRMHPEIEQDHPGTCPKCGMALEPKTITAEPEDASEQRDMTRRFWVAVSLSIPVLLLAMLPMIGVPSGHSFSATQLQWFQFVLTLPVVLWVARLYRDLPREQAVVNALTIVDDHVGFNRVLGSFRQRLSFSILARTGQLSRLIAWYGR